MPPSLRDRLLGRNQNGSAPAAPSSDGSQPAAPGTAAATTDAKVRIQTPGQPPTLAQVPPAEVSKIDPRSVRVAEVRMSAVDQLKLELHRKLVERLDLAALERITDEALLTTQIRNAVIEFIRAEQAPLSANEREEIVEQIIYEVTGLGPIEPLFRDHSISDILVNGPRDVYIERRGKLSRTNITFRDNAHLLTVIDRIVSRVGRRVDESSPMVDARLADGSRVNAIVAPLAIDGASMSIRKFARVPIGMERLVEIGSVPAPVSEVLAAVVKARRNVLISGGTGSGKTTMLNAMSAFVDHRERIVTIEDSAELQLQQEHVVRLETRPSNIEGRGEVSQRELVKNALRMRPDRIIVGEVRAGEAFDMLQAMNTGHDGSMTTVHANSPRDALSRIEQMIGMSGIDIPARSARSQIASAINVVIQVGRLSDGRRKLLSLSELTGMEGEVVTMQEIFRFRQTGLSPEGQVLGKFEATGIRPKFIEQVMSHGVSLSSDLFRPDARLEG